MNHLQIQKIRRETQCQRYFLDTLADKAADFIGYARTTGPLSRVVAVIRDACAAGESIKVTIKDDAGVTLCALYTIDDTSPTLSEIDLTGNIDMSKSVDAGSGLAITIDYTAGGGPTPATGLEVRVYTS